MATDIRRVDHHYATVENQPGEGYELLGQPAQQGINLPVFTAVPMGPTRTQLALLVQGDDRLGVVAGSHANLHESDVHVYAASCVTDGRGSHGYILFIRPDEYERAVQALQV